MIQRLYYTNQERTEGIQCHLSIDTNRASCLAYPVKINNGLISMSLSAPMQRLELSTHKRRTKKALEIANTLFAEKHFQLVEQLATRLNLEIIGQ